MPDTLEGTGQVIGGEQWLQQSPGMYQVGWLQRVQILYIQHTSDLPLNTRDSQVASEIRIKQDIKQANPPPGQRTALHISPKPFRRCADGGYRAPVFVGAIAWQRREIKPIHLYSPYSVGNCSAPVATTGWCQSRL